jgi:hypothetical protein
MGFDNDLFSFLDNISKTVRMPKQIYKTTNQEHGSKSEETH